MKLSEIKILKESSIPSHVIMPLSKIIDDGKITDRVQTFTLAGLAFMFKNGTMPWPRNLNFYFSGSSDEIEAIEALSDTQKVNLAKELLAKLQTSGSYESMAAPNKPFADWVDQVTRKSE